MERKRQHLEVRDMEERKRKREAEIEQEEQKSLEKEWAKNFEASYYIFSTHNGHTLDNNGDDTTLVYRPLCLSFAPEIYENTNPANIKLLPLWSNVTALNCGSITWKIYCQNHCSLTTLTESGLTF